MPSLMQRPHPRVRNAVPACAAPLLTLALLCGTTALADAPASGATTTVVVAASASVAPSPSAGCHAEPAAVAGTQTTTDLTAAGRSGFYITQVPTTYAPPTPMPVVFDFHGYSEPASLQVPLSGLGTLGQAHGFITVTPGINEPVPLWLSTVGSADLAWFGGPGGLLDTVERTLCVDQRRIFVTGYSNGAFMTSAVACQFAGRIAAVAPVAGISDLPHCHPTRPVPVVAFHGTADPFVHFNGTPSKAAADLPNPTGGKGTLGQSHRSGVLQKSPTIPQDTAAWAKRNGCAAKPTDRPAASGVTLVRYSCPHRADVELYVIAGGGHAWPGSTISKSIAKVVGFTTFAINADDIMWAFFAAHPLPSSG